MNESKLKQLHHHRLQTREALLAEREEFVLGPDNSESTARLISLAHEIRCLERDLWESGVWLTTDIGPPENKVILLRLGQEKCFGMWSRVVGFRRLEASGEVMTTHRVDEEDVTDWRLRLPGDPSPNRPVRIGAESLALREPCCCSC